MSAVSDFFTQGSYWWGVISGAVVTAGGGALSLRASDKRKAAQEDKVLDRKEEREDKKSNDQLVREAAMSFAENSAEVLTNSIDVKGLFNAFRDHFNTAGGFDDSMAIEKFMFAETQVDQMIQLTKAFHRLKVVAPAEIVQPASKVVAAFQVVANMTAQPFAKPVALRAAGVELDTFVNAFRQYLKLDPFTEQDAKRESESFVLTLKKQVDDYMAEAKADMKAAGFTSTPWG